MSRPTSRRSSFRGKRYSPPAFFDRMEFNRRRTAQLTQLQRALAHIDGQASGTPTPDEEIPDTPPAQGLDPNDLL